MNEMTKATKRRVHVPAFQRYFNGDGIDVGCGNDSLSKWSHLFPAMRSVAPWDWPQGDAQTLAKVPNNTYDFLHSSHCLEHMREPFEAMHNWIRVVRSGGHLVVMVPDEDMYEQGVWPSRFNGDHKWTFTVFKPKSWSPKSVNLLDMLKVLCTTRGVEVERIEVLRDFYLGLKGTDETMGDAECAIEFVLRKL